MLLQRKESTIWRSNEFNRKEKRKGVKREESGNFLKFLPDLCTIWNSNLITLYCPKAREEFLIAENRGVSASHLRNEMYEVTRKEFGSLRGGTESDPQPLSIPSSSIAVSII